MNKQDISNISKLYTESQYNNNMNDDQYSIELFLRGASNKIRKDGTYIFTPYPDGYRSFAIYFEDGVWKGVKTSEDLPAAPTILSTVKEIKNYVRTNYV